MSALSRGGGPIGSAGHRSLADFAAIAVLAVVTLATRFMYFGHPAADFDEQLYSLIGQQILAGDLPYVDQFDRKPLGLFLLYAAAHAIGGPSALAYQLTASAFALAGAWLLYRLASLLVDRVTATAGGALYLMLMPYYGSHSGQSEILYIPLLLGMALLVRDPAHPRAAARACAAMLIGGLALQIKYTVLPQCLFFGFYALYGQFRRGAGGGRLVKLALVFAALGLAPTVAVGLAYWALGQFEPFFFANFVSFFERGSTPGSRLRLDLARQWIPILILTIGGLLAAATFSRPSNSAIYRFFYGYLAASFVSVYLPGTVYLYYYATLVPGAVLVALPLLDRRGRLTIAPAAMLLTAAWVLLNVPARLRFAQAGTAEVFRLADALEPHVGEDHCLFVFDGPSVLYRLTGSCLPTRFIYPDHLNNARETPALGTSQAGEVVRVLAAEPGAIVTADRAVTNQNPEAQALVKAAIASDYRKLTTARLGTRELTAWVRNESSATEPSPDRGRARATTGTTPLR